MAATAMIHTRVEPQVKRKAEAALKSMGLTVSDAVRLMLTRVSAEGVLPFSVGGYKATQEAVAELRAGKGQRAGSVKEMFAELNK